MNTPEHTETVCGLIQSLCLQYQQGTAAELKKYLESQKVDLNDQKYYYV